MFNEIKERLETIKKDLEESMNNYSLDFVNDYSIESSSYFSDAVNEFADNNISVYYSDQFKYYEEHTSESEDALLELMDGESIAQMIKKEGLYNLCCYAGVCGEYNEITADLYEDEENIKKLLVIRYLLKTEQAPTTVEKLDELLEEIESSNFDRLSDLLDVLPDYLESETEGE